MNEASPLPRPPTDLTKVHSTPTVDVFMQQNHRPRPQSTPCPSHSLHVRLTRGGADEDVEVLWPRHQEAGGGGLGPPGAEHVQGHLVTADGGPRQASADTAGGERRWDGKEENAAERGTTR